MSTSKKLLEAASGGAGGDAVTVDQVFSTTVYTGNAGTQAINNGLDLSGEGGLVWTKSRSSSLNHYLYDTARGALKPLQSNTTEGQWTQANSLTSFNSNGFSVGNSDINQNSVNYASWSFRKAPNFVDIVTYTGNGTAGREIAHSLNSTVGMLIIKELGNANDWDVLHRSTEVLRLNSPAAPLSGYAPSRFGDGSSLVRPTSSVFTVGNSGEVNGNGQTYVAYLFADNSSEAEANRLISCGSYTGNGSTPAGPIVDLGFEPQWLLIKNASASANWYIYDTMRGWPVDSSVTTLLRPDTTDAELGGAWAANNISATGFQIRDDDAHFNTNGSTYIYMAIRAPMMAEPTAATEVFAIDQENSSAPYYTSNFPVDMAFLRRNDNTSDWYLGSRLIQGRELVLNTTAAEGGASGNKFDYMDGWQAGPFASDVYSWMWKRAKGFFDVVTYTGNDTARTIAHSLGVVPEMIWIKTRSTSNAWWVYYGDNTDYLVLNTDAATVDSNYPWQDTSPTSSVFTVGDIANVNENNATIIAYLFATLAGVSKIGTVTHSGSSTDVACGFSAGARFVMLKRIDATGDWYVWDSVHGIVSGNSPYLLLNSTAGEVTNTDFIDPYSAGFTITSSFTAGTYIFYAIA